jgi:hypothetical protein
MVERRNVGMEEWRVGEMKGSSDGGWIDGERRDGERIYGRRDGGIERWRN